MSWKHCGPGRRGYHHGNLREALIQSALSLIGEKGPAGFTIAEAARSAGVSPAAPYRHFRDREELMAEVARLGFERFANDLEKAWHGGNPSPLEALQNVGRAFLAFARNEPAYYAAMFETGLPKAEDLGLQEWANRAFDVLSAATKKLNKKNCRKTRPPRPDGCAAHLGNVGRYRLAFRTGKRPSRIGDRAGRPAGGRCPSLSSRVGVGRRGRTRCYTLTFAGANTPQLEYVLFTGSWFGYRLNCQVQIGRPRRCVTRCCFALL